MFYLECEHDQDFCCDATDAQSYPANKAQLKGICNQVQTKLFSLKKCTF